jgi:hypothetical protein
VKVRRHKSHERGECKKLGLGDDDVLLGSRQARDPERERYMHAKACHKDPKTIKARGVRAEQGRRKLNVWWDWLDPIPRGGKGAPPRSITAKAS